MEQQKVKRTLKYEFSITEIQALGTELANKNQELLRIEDRKASVVSDYGSQIKICKEQINQLSDRVASGYEMKDVYCTVDYHQPEMNKKLLTRTDTGEQWTEPMNDTDHNLFNQWEEKERERLENEDDECEHEDDYDDEFNESA
jgi:deoxyribodipyrimidine photolyase